MSKKRAEEPSGRMPISSSGNLMVGLPLGEIFSWKLISHSLVVGLLLVSAGFVLFLLPFSLATYQSKGWASGMIIAMLVIGILCLIAFVLYEKFLSKRSFIPFYLLKTPSVIGACLLAMFLFVSF